MTISTELRKAGPFTGNGVTTAFPFSFKVFAATDVAVTVANTQGNESALALGADYAVALNADQDAAPGGTVTLAAPLSTGYLLVVSSAVPNLQPTDITNNGGFYPRVIEDALDRHVAQVQQIDEKVGRALKVAITSPLGDQALPSPVAGMLIGWNESSDGLKNYAPIGGTLLGQQLAAADGSSLVGFRQAGTGAVVRTAQDKMREWVSVKDFGAVGDGSDATTAFALAQTYCATTGATMFVPSGQYEISNELAFPNYYIIEGDGYGTNIILNLSAGKFCFKEAANFRYAWAIRNVRFTIKAGASTDVGAISIAKHLRGGLIENVSTYEVEQPFVLGPQIYGNLRVKGIRAYRVASAVPSVRTCFYGYGEANTVFCDDLEILGSWSLGFHLNGGRVGSLTNFNVAGSTDAQMVEGIRVENYGNMSIQDGWVEQLTVVNTAAAVYVKNSSDVVVKNVNVASGSLYFDGGSDNHASAIYYGNANGGLKLLNDAKVNVNASALKFQADGAGYANGQAFQVDAPRLPSGGMFRNPTLLNGLQSHIGRTNVSLVTIADNATTFESGTLSKELTTATNFQGAQFDATCVAGRTYTCVVRAMLVEKATDLYLGQGTDTTRNGGYLYNRGTGTAGQWRTLICTASSSTSTISFRLLASGVTGTAKFLVDSVQIYEGVNHAEPQLLADPGFREGSVTYDPPSLADGAGVTTTLTVTGATPGDAVAGVSFANDLQGITVTGWVSAANTVSVRFQNETGGTIDLASGVLRARVLKLV